MIKVVCQKLRICCRLPADCCCLFYKLAKLLNKEVATAMASMCLLVNIEQKCAFWHVSDGFNSHAYRYSVITWCVTIYCYKWSWWIQCCMLKHIDSIIRYAYRYTVTSEAYRCNLQGDAYRYNVRRRSISIHCYKWSLSMQCYKVTHIDRVFQGMHIDTLLQVKLIDVML